MSSTAKTSINIVDINGVMRIQAVVTGSTYSINTASLTRGHYLLKLQHIGSITTLPFVKE